jgi:hypothetical protein
VSHPENKIFIVDFVKCTPLFTEAEWRSDSRSLNSFLETDHGPNGYGTNMRDVGYHHNGFFNSLMGDMHVINIKESNPDDWVAVGEK